MDENKTQPNPPSRDWNIPERIDTCLATLKTTHSQQGQVYKILTLALGLLVFCCLCAFLFSLFRVGARNALRIVSSPILPTVEGTQPTPTALFGFGSTPFPTLVAPSPSPTTPSPATATLLPTQTILPAATPIPASTNTNQPTASSSNSVVTIGMDKRAEYVEIQNTGNDHVNLTDWRLVSETGNQPCTLWVTLLPNETLRIWSREGNGGVSCGYDINIWNDNQPDPAVLYDAQGRETSRYP